MPSLSLRYGGYDVILETYQKLQERYQGYFQLIDLNLEHCIHLTFLKEFIYELSLREKYLLQKKQMIREKQYKRSYQNFGDIFHQFSRKNKKLTLNTIYDFQKNYTGDNERCAEMINNLPILYYPQDKNHKIESTPEICQDFIDSLLWTSHYYFKECVDWKWCTTYDKTPLLKDLSSYINHITDLSFKTDKNEYTIEEQLKFIFPKESHKLHQYKINSKDSELMIDLAGSRYLWECPILFS